MIDHVSITVSDMGRAAPFYRAVMAALGVPCVGEDARWLGFGARDGVNSYLSVFERGPVVADARHWCFRAPNRAAVDAFHAAALALGGACDGPPGLRPHYHAHYCAAFVTDPDGNRLEAVTHGPVA